MIANFVYIISNIYESSNIENEIVLEQHHAKEVQTDRIEDIVIPKNASAIILFKNEILNRSGGEPTIEKFCPTNIKQYVITTGEFLSLPKLYLTYSVAKDLIDDAVGAYVLRDGTLFLVNENQKRTFTPIQASEIDESGRLISKSKTANMSKI